MTPLDVVAEGLLDFIVRSNGIEVYRVVPSVKLRPTAEMERYLGPAAFKIVSMAEFNTYLEAAQATQKDYPWVEGYDSVGDALLIRTDSPVLDIPNRVVPDPEEAERRLSDLREIQRFLDNLFRDVRRMFRDPEFWKRSFQLRGSQKPRMAPQKD